MNNATAWASYPMGPTLQHVLEISENAYKGGLSPKPSEAAKEQFGSFLEKHLLNTDNLSRDEVIGLLEELTAMDMPSICLDLAAKYSHCALDQDFRAMLSLGSASMRESELESAKNFLKKAQLLEPQELAPYVNLAEIYFHLKRDDEAIVWSKKGLGVEPNQRRLWEITARIEYDKDPNEAPKRVKAHALKINSFSGLSLAAQMTDKNDHLLQVQYMEEHYQGGGRESNFLIEWTAALGQAGQFDRILQILWEAENLPQFEGRPPWQLYLHGCQAALGLEQFDKAAAIMTKIELRKDLPPEASQDLQSLQQEISEHKKLKERMH